MRQLKIRLNAEWSRRVRDEYKGGVAYLNPAFDPGVITGVTIDVNSLYPAEAS